MFLTRSALVGAMFMTGAFGVRLLPDDRDYPKGEVVYMDGAATRRPDQSSAGSISRLSVNSAVCSKSDKLHCPGVGLLQKKEFNPPNGCGPEKDGAFWDFLGSRIDTSWAHQCCIGHDACFGSCNDDFDKCNNVFAQCLRDTCRGQPCAAFVPLYVAAVSSVFSCQHYVSGINEYCECPPSAYTQPQFGSYRQYFWVLYSYTPNYLRSHLNDANTVMAGADVNHVDGAGGWKVKYQGAQGDGHTSNPFLNVSFWAYDTDIITLWGTIYNGDTRRPSQADVNAVLGADGLATYTYLAGDLVNAGMQMLGEFVTLGYLSSFIRWVSSIWADCDGWNVQYARSYTGAELYAQTQGGQISENLVFDGYPARDNCGHLSQYTVGFVRGLLDVGGTTPTSPTS